MIGSMIIGFFASVLGLVISYYLDIPSGATIIFTLVVLYLIARVIKVVTFGRNNQKKGRAVDEPEKNY